MKKQTDKTNVMRLLDQKKLSYRSFFYDDSRALCAPEVAALLAQDENRVFKTLVTVAGSGAHYVFLVPAFGELNLKKAAKSVGEKSIAMLPARELLPLTGYIHGGCSPLGVKKLFPTVIDASAQEYETIFFSAGRIGCQVEISLAELKKALNFMLCDILA